MEIGLDTETDDGVMVQWALASNQPPRTGQTIEELIQAFDDITQHELNITCFIHNIAYDGEFIRALFKHLEKQGLEAFYVRPRALIAAIFNDKRRRIVFCCTVNLSYGMSLQAAGKLVGLPKLEGPDFYVGWSKERDFSNPNEWSYVIRDAEICLKLGQTFRAQGIKGITAASSARLLALAATFGDDYLGQMRWNEKLPPPPLEVDQWLRPAYGGGDNYTIGRKRVKGPIQHTDARSMYPTVLVYDPLPVGHGKYTRMKPGGLYIVKQTVTLKLKKNGRAIFSFKKGADALPHGYKANEPVKATAMPIVVTWDSVTEVLMNKHYHVVECGQEPPLYMAFRQETGLFGDFMRIWYEIKKNAKTPGEKGAAKLILNSFYGGLGINPIQEQATLGDDLIWYSERKPVENAKGYVPAAIFITAHARRRLDEAMTKVTNAGGTLLHGDTDSIIYVGPPPEAILPIGIEMGEWSNEEEGKSPCIEYLEGGAKRYAKKRLDGSLDLTFAGLTQRSYNDGVPYGSWIELLDKPDRILDDDAVFGDEHYYIESQWLRDLYINSGRNPNDVNTLKLQMVTQREGGKKAVYRKFHTNQAVGYRRR